MNAARPTRRPRPLRHLAALLISSLALIAATAAWAASERGPLRSTPSFAAEDADGARVIVKYKALGQLMRPQMDGTVPARGPQHAATMSSRHGLVLRDGRVIDRRSQVVRGGTEISSAALAARLAADPEVEYAVPDQRRYALAVPNDPLYAGGSSVSPAAGQWYLRAPDATFVSATNAIAAWSLSTGAAAIVVADIDTGVLPGHPDLAGKLYAGYDFITSSTTAADGGARDADATDPGDWNTAGECGRGTAAASSSWHGTQTSGLIGAQTGNGVGMAAAGHDTMVLPVRVLGKCGGVDSDIIAGMLWAGGVSSLPTANPHPARVLNLSLGSTGACSAAYQDAIAQLNAVGVVVVVAAGNEEGLAVGTPANCSGAIAVAGVRHTGTKVGYSSIGPEVSIAAPAGNCVNSSGACLYPILTTTNAGTQAAAGHTYSDSSNYSVGTSFAAPLVAGTAALMLAANPALTPAAVKSLLKSSARAFPTSGSAVQCHAPNAVAQDECLCTTSTCGAGLLDAGAAVAAAAAGTAPTANISPGATSVLAGASVSFDGSGSAAASGRSITSYRWALTAGSSIAVFNGATDGASVQLLTRGTGSFTVQLTVTDNLGLQASSSATVTVNAPAAPTVRLLASASVVAAGDTVTLDGSSSSAASGLSVASYQWAITAGSELASFSGASNGATAALATLGSGSGRFTVQLTVTDSLGQSASALQNIDVTAVTPVASIAASALSVAAGGSLSFDGSGSTATAGRTITGYRWALTSGSDIASISGSASGPVLTVATLAAGSFTVQLTVTDSAGAQDVQSTRVGVDAVNTTSSGGGSSGGGAASPVWLLGLAAAATALAAGRRR